jgi:hypothetical protein
LIELCGIIDMDRGRSWRTSQRVLTGHLIIADCGLQRTAAITGSQISALKLTWGLSKNACTTHEQHCSYKPQRTPVSMSMSTCTV